MKRTIVGLLIGVGFVTALLFAVSDQIRVTCEVCMVYKGRQACEETTAVDRTQALMQATATACAQISGGVTDGIQCNNVQPLSIRCTE